MAFVFGLMPRCLQMMAERLITGGEVPPPVDQIPRDPPQMNEHRDEGPPPLRQRRPYQRRTPPPAQDDGYGAHMPRHNDEEISPMLLEFFEHWSAVKCKKTPKTLNFETTR